MNTDPPIVARGPSGLVTEVAFTQWVRQVVKGAAELQAFEAGEIDAVMDAGSNSAILSPRARIALQGSNRVVREVLDALPVGACALDLAGNVVSTNKAWRAFVDERVGAGLGVKEGANFFTACETANASERAHAEAVVKGFREVLAGVRQEYWVDYFCRTDLGSCAFRLTIAPIAPDGVLHGLVTREFIRADEGTDAWRDVVQSGAGHFMAASQARVPNRLLADLPGKDYKRLLANFEPINLSYGQVLYAPGERIKYVYFPTDCLVSLLTVVEGNRSLEVGLVGREGMVGTPLVLGSATSSARAVVQGSGAAVRMRSGDLLKEFECGPDLRRALLGFINVLMNQVTQNAACNRFHNLEERLARWLLMTRERLTSDNFCLTHEFLADMLGTRRESVTDAAHALKRRHLISYVRGNMTILNQRGLERASCSCYSRIKIAGPLP
jgi:CRP-like cAMP-binding protein